MLQINNIEKSYKSVRVVNISNLEIQAGESFGLVGNNGAGKTTIFRMMLDLIRPTKGEVLSKGENVMGSEHWKKYTGSFLDEGFLIGFLTPDEYFDFVGDLNGMNKAEIAERLKPYHDFFNDEIVGKKKYIRDLSKGNQKKVGIVAAMMINPEILMLDEPFANLDPTTQIRLKNLISDFQTRTQATVLISSHDLSHVTDVCKRIAVMEKGEIVKDLQSTESTLKDLEEYFSVALNNDAEVEKPDG
ncbi:MAG: ABC-2 type transport system ATP-binding protein [Flammeovirgaceae bacterium]|jgi:ABC-2 type transport system ATP-binding protein